MGKLLNPAFNYYYSVIFLIACSLALSSCGDQQHSAKEKAFSKMFPIPEMNTKIRFWDPSRMLGTPRIGETLDLSLENFSPEKIIFPSDFGLRIFTYDDQSKSWEEIGNDTIYFPEGNRQISPKGTDLPGVILIGSSPMVFNEGKPVDIRVVVIGSIARDGTPTTEKVGAWVDVTLQP